MSNSTRPAFPVVKEPDYINAAGYGGLTKRELIAAMAMQGLLALGPIEGGSRSTEAQTQHAVFLADALLAALDRGAV